MDLGLTDRVFLLTGASRGLGRATAEALVAEGAKVVVSARDGASVDRAVDELGAEQASGVAADLGDPAAAGALLEAVLARHGRLDGALVSVGGPPTGRLLTLDDEAWTNAFHTVFLGAVRLARTVAPVLPDDGALAFVLSRSVKEPLDNLAISNGLRPGLGMLVKTLSDELGPRGVRVNGLMPGSIDTERLREIEAASEDPATARRTGEGSVPLRRYGRPEEFGRVAAFVLSPAASYVSGAMIPVDGGAQRSL